jgi:phosphate transport system substrate-binding protein
MAVQHGFLAGYPYQEDLMNTAFRHWKFSCTIGSGLLAAVFGAALAGTAHAQAGERIAIDGSTGVRPLVAALAQAYREHNPGVTIEIGQGLGTKARLKALAEGRIDIAMASHGLVIADVVKQGMAVEEIAKVAVVFGVNAAVPVRTLADAQVCELYSRRLVQWKDVGGPDLPVVAMTRPESEVDTEVVRARVACLKDLKMPKGVQTMSKSGDMARALAATTGAFGMTTMTVVEQSGAKIRPVWLNGVEPSAENVRSGAYSLTRDSFLVTKAGPSPAVARFLAFVGSAEGKRVITANGAVAPE